MWSLHKAIVGYTALGESIADEILLKIMENISKVFMPRDNIIRGI